jgi:phosphonate transport system substrate-binding protein
MLQAPFRLAIGLLLILSASSLCAQERSEPISVGIVPQQAATRLAALWAPILAEIGARAGLNLEFRTAPDIPTFEQRLAEGAYDIAYMNPYHYTVFSQTPGYRAFAKQRDKRIRGILVTRQDAGIDDIAALDGSRLAFPAPAAFAASLLPRAALKEAGIDFEPNYVRSHDSVYRAVAQGLYPAGGGIERTFANTDPEVRKQLRVLWRTQGFTSHPFAAHPRVDPAVVDRVRDAMIGMSDDPTGQALLATIGFGGIESAQDADWNDVRALEIDLLDGLGGGEP